MCRCAAFCATHSNGNCRAEHNAENTARETPAAGEAIKGWVDAAHIRACHVPTDWSTFCQSACARIWRALGAATHENAKRAIKLLPDFIKSTMNLDGMT
jgi:hypothetical protein